MYQIDQSGKIEQIEIDNKKALTFAKQRKAPLITEGSFVSVEAPKWSINWVSPFGTSIIPIKT